MIRRDFLKRACAAVPAVAAVGLQVAPRAPAATPEEDPRVEWASILSDGEELPAELEDVRTDGSRYFSQGIVRLQFVTDFVKEAKGREAVGFVARQAGREILRAGWWWPIGLIDGAQVIGWFENFEQALDAMGITKDPTYQRLKATAHERGTVTAERLG